ncbi:MAG: hypothetical protein Q7R30_01150 [Acidobacteriota bacterium]|nr:hypothetical protein [Acidobacteriota bacterium]
MKTSYASAFLLLGVLAVPAPSQAQPEFVKDNVTKIVRKLGVHVNLTVREPLDQDVTKGRSFGASVVLGGGRTAGWKYPFALTTFDEYLHAPDGGQFATLKSWAIVGGVGYGWNIGKLTISPAVQTGVAFNSARLDGNAALAFNADGPVSIKVGNSLLLRPKLTLEYFLTQKFTLRTSADYVLTQPNITVTTPSGSIGDRWNASNFHATVGIGFYPFRK